MQAEVVAIGTELLLGDIIDTNSSWIAQQLTTLGLNLFYTHTVGDNVVRISEVLKAALSRSDVVITTGGLGPTVDDWTREAVAAAFGRSLEFREELLEEVAAFFKRRGRAMTENNRKQAMLPAGATVIHNPVGTAPCFALEENGHLIISLPGVPFEMKYLMENTVIPLLRRRFNLTGIIKSRVLHTCGIGESALADHFTDLMYASNPTIGTAAHPGQTDIRITAKAASEAAAAELIAPVEQILRERVGEWIYGTDSDTLPGVVLKLLRDKGLTLGSFETACAGQLNAWISRDPLAPGVYRGGITLTCPLSTSAITSLGVIPVSPDSTQEEAENAARALLQTMNCELGLAVTGRCEQEATEDSPAYLALATPTGIVRTSPRLARTGANGRGWLLHYALDMIRRYLAELPLE
ncbi:MAG: CinA family nicotinamide mononucleotide deamidase-related protein [Anaerolineae bacterium]